MRSVYIETTIPSYYHDNRKSVQAQAWAQATRAWWDQHRHEYRIVTSELVRSELERAPEPKRSRGLSLLDHAEMLSLDDPELPGIIDFYIDNLLVPRDAAGDAGHLAVASIHRIDFVLTWNCRHLANANKVRHLQVLNGRLGLATPVLTTPLSLIPE